MHSIVKRRSSLAGSPRPRFFGGEGSQENLVRDAGGKPIPTRTWTPAPCFGLTGEVSAGLVLAIFADRRRVDVETEFGLGNDIAGRAEFGR